MTQAQLEHPLADGGNPRPRAEEAAWSADELHAAVATPIHIPTSARFAILQGLAGTDPRSKLLRFGRSSGQTAAMSAGLDFSQGR